VPPRPEELGQRIQQRLLVGLAQGHVGVQIPAAVPGEVLHEGAQDAAGQRPGRFAGAAPAVPGVRVEDLPQRLAGGGKPGQPLGVQAGPLPVEQPQRRPQVEQEAGGEDGGGPGRIPRDAQGVQEANGIVGVPLGLAGDGLDQLGRERGDGGQGEGNLSYLR
jgi:hypothetical protein